MVRSTGKNILNGHKLEGSAVRAEIVKISSETPEISLIKYAADQIRAGEVLGMPTDTFYGLAADPFNLRAVDRVYDIKTRSRRGSGGGASQVAA
jgi:hypothetical protein